MIITGASRIRYDNGWLPFFFLLEGVSDGKMEGEVASEIGMEDGIMFAVVG